MKRVHYCTQKSTTPNLHKVLCECLLDQGEDGHWLDLDFSRRTKWLSPHVLNNLGANRKLEITPCIKQWKKELIASVTRLARGYIDPMYVTKTLRQAENQFDLYQSQQINDSDFSSDEDDSPLPVSDSKNSLYKSWGSVSGSTITSESGTPQTILFILQDRDTKTRSLKELWNISGFAICEQHANILKILVLCAEGGQGLGQILLHTILKHAQTQKIEQVNLRAIPSIAWYYSSLGFQLGKGPQKDLRDILCDQDCLDTTSINGVYMYYPLVKHE